MPQATVNTEINQTYTELKTLLIRNKNTITTENPPTTITAVQGSIWGTTPKTAKKQTTYRLHQDKAGTHIASASRLTRDYKALTLIGCLFAAALMLLCFWIGWDLQNYAANGSGFWAWLAWSSGTFGHFEPDAAALLIKVTWILAVFLAVTLIAEALIVANVHAKIDATAEENLKRYGNRAFS